MRILNLDGPYFIDAFRAAGHEVVSIGIAAGCNVVISSPLHAYHAYTRLCEQGFVPDAVVYADFGNLPYFPTIEALPCPCVYYSIDTYCNPWHLGMAYAFDHIFVAQREHVNMFSSQDMPATWLPLFAKSKSDVCHDQPRDIPVAFVGSLSPKNIPDRKPFLENFRRLHPLFMTSGAYVDIFNRSHIVLNQTAASELNFRCFEAMACGAALLMEHSPHGLEDLFTPGEHLLPLYTRGDAVEAAAIARHALAQPEALAAIARNGQECVARFHTDTHRVATVVDILDALVRQQAHTKRFAELAVRRKHLASAYAMLFAELDDAAFAPHREHFLSLSAYYDSTMLLPSDVASQCEI